MFQSEGDISTFAEIGMEAFSDWQDIASAPTDGTEIMAGNQPTGLIHIVSFSPSWFSDTPFEKRKLSNAVVWWRKHIDGTERAFVATHWRPV
ncbi:hypothetical protein HFO56_39480 [Rhizobium laguerreae]|uniref:hypothetical protein n=1 Tax=Rhizobium laguerreae TaxID=1076926 RepID=UPI001C90E069|nr:hypothetical protein [Rhizobium laguerreae]MBY3158383.1 hypothetical protein [Rhizobium laguerreae]